MAVTHATTTAEPNDPAYDVSNDAWEEAHTIGDGSFVAAKLSATATDKVFGRSTAGAGNGEEIPLTAAGRALIDDANAAAQLVTLGLVPGGTTTFYRADGTFATPAGSGVAQGTSFPGGPSTNDHFCRTDLNNMEFFFDGTRWRSVQVFVLPMGVWNSAHTSFAATVNGVFRTTCPPSSGGSDWYILEHTIAFFISGGTALSGSVKWVGTFVKTDAANANTTVATQTIDSGTLDIHRRQAVAVNALLGTTFPLLQSNWTKTGTPGTFFIQEAFTYQIVAV